jgi:hypothetical protein
MKRFIKAEAKSVAVSRSPIDSAGFWTVGPDFDHIRVKSAITRTRAVISPLRRRIGDSTCFTDTDTWTGTGRGVRRFVAGGRRIHGGGPVALGRRDEHGVFQKTGLHRQAQLAALLARVARTFGSGLRCPE